MITPNPIDGWHFEARSRTLRWVEGSIWNAQPESDDEISVRVANGCISIEDGMSDLRAIGTYSVPLSVVDKLRKLQAAEDVATEAAKRQMEVGGLSRGSAEANLDAARRAYLVEVESTP